MDKFTYAGRKGVRRIAMSNENRSERFVLDIDGCDLFALNHALRPYGVRVMLDELEMLAHVVRVPHDTSEPAGMSQLFR